MVNPQFNRTFPQLDQTTEHRIRERGKSMLRRTKIIATIGPASESEASLRAMMEAGMDVARLGLAHGTLEEHLARYRRIRDAAKHFGHPIGILVDLPGPKVRTGLLPEAGVLLAEEALIKLVPGNETSHSELLHIEYDNLLSDVQVGDRLTFGDGAIVVEIVDKDGSALHANVVHGGVLRGRPGVHIPAERLRLAAPTCEDLRLLDAFIEQDVDMVAISFVRSAHDVRRVGTESWPRGPLVVAKIETHTAVENLEGIIEASGAVMVARGDLGAECPIEELPHLQKEIIRQCIAHGRPAITATQMLESMVEAATPTRAEASDVANAVFDGSSALMLSAETAIGHDPINAVRTMARIALRADQEFDYSGWGHNLSRMRLAAGKEETQAVTDTMTMAAWRAATELNAAAIICLTRTGFTVRSMARFRPVAQILGFTPSERVVRQLTLSWGARPIYLPELTTTNETVQRAVALACEAGYVRSGDLVAVLAGADQKTRLSTDLLRLIRVTP